MENYYYYIHSDWCLVIQFNIIADFSSVAYLIIISVAP